MYPKTVICFEVLNPLFCGQIDWWRKHVDLSSSTGRMLMDDRLPRGGLVFMSKIKKKDRHNSFFNARNASSQVFLLMAIHTAHKNTANERGCKTFQQVYLRNGEFFRAKSRNEQISSRVYFCRMWLLSVCQVSEKNVLWLY